MPVFELFFTKTYSIFVRARSEKTILSEDIDYMSLDGELAGADFEGLYTVPKEEESSVREVTVSLSKIKKHTEK